MMTDPTLTLLSLGAGVQSTVLLLLSASGDLPKLDAAIFADTGWEPRAVYDHLGVLEREVAGPAGIPIHRVRASEGGIRADALDTEHRFASMPTFTRNPDGSKGMVRRQCTGEYKIAPIKRKVRELLGYPHPRPVPRDVYAEQWVGISRDEVQRAKDSDVRYSRNRFPLLDLDLTRRDCLRILHQRGFASTPKSACIGCPFHGNRHWRDMRDNNPEEWADAVAFDEAIRSGNARANADGRPLLGQMYLHSSLEPLGSAPIDRKTRADKAADQLNLMDWAADVAAGVDVDAYDPEVGAPDGCGPWSCRSDGL